MYGNTCACARNQNCHTQCRCECHATATLTAKDATFGDTLVTVEERNGGVSAYGRGQYEGGRRFTPRRYEMEIDNQWVRHLGTGRVVKRLAATQKLPPRVVVEMDAE